MKLRISLIIKVLFIVAITFAGTLFFLFSHNLMTVKKNFMESEREKAIVVLQTLIPIVSINESFGFDSSIEEQIIELKKQNKSIIDVIININTKPIPSTIKSKNNIVESVDIMDYFNPNKKIGVITIIYSNHNYLKLVEDYKNYILYTSTIVGFILLVLTVLLYCAFLPLKKLAKIVKVYDFKKTDVVLEKFKGRDEVSDIGNAISELLLRVSEYTKELSDLNEHLQDRVDEQTIELITFNKELQKKISESVEKIRIQDATMISQSRHAAMGEMIDNIAHQWKQPLNLLAIIIQDIKDASAHNELDTEYINNSVKNSMECLFGMSKTIDDFRNFFRPDKEKNLFSLSKTIEYALRMTKSRFKNSNIKIEIEGTDLQVLGMQNELAQVIINIINNARDAFEEKQITTNAYIAIRILKKDNKPALEIEDTAGGIPEKIISKIFDPYFTTKSDDRGTGIGLYMSKKIIVDSMDGTIDVKNAKNAQGIVTGALFTIILKDQDS